MVASKRRSLVKTITWRVIATTDTFILAWLFTSDEVIAASIASGSIRLSSPMSTGTGIPPVSYTHLTLPTICSV